jgi:Uma2 family endonuclease
MPATVEKTVLTEAWGDSPRRTYAQVCAELPETNQPCELWEGKIIMSPSPSFFHQKVVLRLYRHLYDWVARRELGEVITAPLDMVLSEHRVTQPDVAFITQQRLHIIERAIMGPADLVAEVISLGDRSRDRIEKRDLYEQYGVLEYWIIDPEARSVEVLALEHGSYQLVMRCGPGQVAASRLLPGFEIKVDALLQGL